jgi:hypothetical protein
MGNFRKDDEVCGRERRNEKGEIEVEKLEEDKVKMV